VPIRSGDVPIEGEREAREMRRDGRFQVVLGLAVGASVGDTVSEATEVDAVLREADVAMYTAKARGKGRYELAASSA
jgi:GGDEF domain-containing protein